MSFTQTAWWLESTFHIVESIYAEFLNEQVLINDYFNYSEHGDSVDDCFYLRHHFPSRTCSLFVKSNHKND